MSAGYEESMLRYALALLAAGTPFVSVHAPTSSTAGTPIAVDYHGMSSGTMTLRSFYRADASACPAGEPGDWTPDITENPAEGSFTYGSQLTIPQPGTYLLCAYLSEDSTPAATSQAQLTVTGSAPAPACVVPDVVGRRLPKATRMLARAHCRLGRVTHRRRPARAGRVLAQSPRAGVTATGPVRLTVARPSG